MTRRTAAAAVVFLALPLLVAPRLLLGETFWLRDAWMMAWPMRDRCAAAWAELRLPLWTADAAAGVPLLGNPSVGAAYPLNALLNWLPSGVGLGWLAAVHLSIAGLGARWLARVHGASRRASWLAGLAYALSGPAVSHLSTIQHGTAMAWMPVALAAGRRAAAGGRPRWIALAAAALALQVLGGEAQLAAYTGAALVLDGVLDPPPAGRRAALGPVAAIAGLAAVLAAVQILPTVEWLGQVGQQAVGGGVSQGRGQPWAFATMSSWRPDTLVAALLVPDLLGRPTQHWWAIAFGIPARFLWHAFVGLSPLWLAFQGGTRSGWRGPAAWAVLAGWLALGSWGGLYWLCFHVVPGFASFRFPDKALPLLALGVAVLAARGVDRWVSVPVRWGAWRDQVLWVAGAFLVAMGLAVALLGPVMLVPDLDRDPALHQAAPWLWPGLRAALLAGAALAALSLTRAGRRAGGARGAVALAAVSAAELMWVNAPIADTRPAAAFAAPAPAAALFGPASPLEWRCNGAWRGGPLTDRAAALDVRGWNERTRRHWRMYGACLEGRATLTVYETSALLGYLDLVSGSTSVPWLGALAMRDVLAEMPLRFPELELLGSPEPGVYAYRNRAALPRARLVGAFEAAPDMARLRARVASPDFPHAERVCLLSDCLGQHHEALATLDPGAAAAGRARVERDTGGQVWVATDAPGPTLLCLADWDYPGWGVTVDGVAAPLIAVHGRLRGVVVPGGAHRVTFTLHSGAAAWGAAGSLAGVCALVAWCWWDRRRRRGAAREPTR